VTAFATVLFDLDGTLTDSYLGFERSLLHALAHVGVAPPDDLRQFVGPPLELTFRGLGLDDAGADEALAVYRERYWDVGYLENEVYAGIPELLDALDTAGVRAAVATSKPEPTSLRILEHFDLARRFAVIGGATFDGTRSHKHEVLAHTLATLAPLSDPSAPVIMVGDRRFDVEGARHHGLEAIGVLWGYGDRAELEAAGAWAIAPTVEELRTLLLS
jgi:phosphoglycolate phosphatase